MSEKIYTNAPLLEVICEIRWQLQSFGAVPHLLADPFFDDFLEEASKRADQEGFSHLERLQPSDVPREVRPHLVEQRFRPSQDTWPLFQIGPGVFSVNATPPYGGWRSFRQVIENCVDILLSSYPVASRYLKISRLELRYINAFDRKNYQSVSSHDFFSNYFQIKPSVPDDFLAKFAGTGSPRETELAVVTPLNTPADSEARLALSKGTNRGIPSYIAENIVRVQREKPAPMVSAEIMEWLDQAHEVTNASFEGAITSSLRDHIGPMEDAKGAE